MATAWGCVLWAPIAASRKVPQEEAAALFGAFGGHRSFVSVPEGISNYGPGWAVVLVVDARPPVPPPGRPASRAATAPLKQVPMSPDDRVVEILTAGWPLACLVGHRRRHGTSTTEHALAQPPPVLQSLGVRPLRVLPLKPRVVGLVADAAFFGAVLWLAIPGPRVARRWLRRRGGRCPMCGYNLRGAPQGGCAECGWER